MKQLKEKNSSWDNKAKINVDFIDFVSDMVLEIKFKLRYFLLFMCDISMCIDFFKVY